MAPAGQVWSTVADLATWAGVLAGRRPEVLAPATAREMGGDRLASGYGLGLRLVDVAGTTYVGHTGSMPGFLASLFVDQATGDGTIALANATTGLDADGVARDLLTGDDPAPVPRWLPTGTVPEEVARPVRRVVLGQHRDRAALADDQPDPVARGHAPCSRAD